jgi:hypothetical protein
MDSPRDAGPPERKPYRRPEIRKVPLRPEEAVLGNCKTGAEPMNPCTVLAQSLGS